MKTKLISPTKELQQELLLRIDLMTVEKIQSLQGKPVTYEDVVELDILGTISSHLNAVFELSTEEVPFEILSAWSMIKIHKELLNLYMKQTKLKDDLYLDLLDKVANRLFISLFTTH